MEKGTKNLIVCFLLAISILPWLGCGKRTTSTAHTSIKNDSLQINNSFELTQNATFSDIGTIRPFDPLKPMLWNGYWHYNTVIEFDKSIKKGIYIKANDNLSYTGSEANAGLKETQSNNRNLLWIGLTAVIGTLFVIYLTLTKYKIL